MENPVPASNQSLGRKNEVKISDKEETIINYKNVEVGGSGSSYKLNMSNPQEDVLPPSLNAASGIMELEKDEAEATLPLKRNEGQIAHEEVMGGDKCDPSCEETEKSLHTKEKFKRVEDITKTGMSWKHEDFARYWKLYKALTLKDWNEAEDFINKNPQVLTAIISGTSETVFHVIAKSNQDGASRLLRKLLPMVPPEVLEHIDGSGNTALIRSAAVGNTKAAKLFVNHNKNLPNIRTNDALFPLHIAAENGHKETVKYLLSVTVREDSNPFAGPTGISLVLRLLRSNLYDIAFDLLKVHPTLAREEKGDRITVLELLATKPTGFASGNQLGYWKRLIYHCIPVQEDCIHDCLQARQNIFALPESVDGDTENPIQRLKKYSTKSTSSGFLRKMGTTSGNLLLLNLSSTTAPRTRGIHDTKLMHIQTAEIVRMMCDGVSWSFEEAVESLKKPLLIAAEMGISEIVKEIIRAYVYSLNYFDDDENNVFMIAIIHHHEKVFKLISLMPTAENRTDKYGNTILHLAGRLAPARQVPGAALQMQRELQWFKAVQNYVSPSFQEKRNSSNKTPRDVFTEQHKELVKEGEQWMKDTASSCTVVASLVTTVVFAAAFTVPGGNDSEGIPNFVRENSFLVFVISDVLALFSSITSLLVFLGIFALPYPQEDFLMSLPNKLIIGLITLFFSIANMMVAFGATVYIALSNSWKWVIFPISLLGCVPVTLFATMLFPLLLNMIISTYRPSILRPIL